jgi:hypothetical protein
MVRVANTGCSFFPQPESQIATNRADKPASLVADDIAGIGRIGIFGT